MHLPRPGCCRRSGVSCLADSIGTCSSSAPACQRPPARLQLLGRRGRREAVRRPAETSDAGWCGHLRAQPVRGSVLRYEPPPSRRQRRPPSVTVGSCCSAGWPAARRQMAACLQGGGATVSRRAMRWVVRATGRRPAAGDDSGGGVRGRRRGGHRPPPARRPRMDRAHHPQLQERQTVCHQRCDKQFSADSERRAGLSGMLPARRGPWGLPHCGPTCADETHRRQPARPRRSARRVRPAPAQNGSFRDGVGQWRCKRAGRQGAGGDSPPRGGPGPRRCRGSAPARPSACG